MVYERADGDATLTGWYFEAVLRQEFDYSRYPFDREDVWIRLWPSQLDPGILFAPDLGSYDTLDPAHQPGVEQQNFVLEGWKVSHSFFSYRLNHYNTSLGLAERAPSPGGESSATRPRFAELYFNVGLERQFLDPFIGNLIPVAVVALLLFGMLLTIRNRAAENDRLGFNTANVLGFCAALFFVVILAHTSLRERLAAQGIIYFEYFYFVLYLAILAVGANSILVVRPGGRWIHHRENLVARLAYWPLLSGSLLVVTLAAFG